jgi:hypothetical protein
MALTKRLQMIELAREFSKNPPANVPPKFQAALDALVAAWNSFTKAQKKNHRENMRDELVAAWSRLPVSAAMKATMTAAANADIAADAEVQP